MFRYTRRAALRPPTWLMVGALALAAAPAFSRNADGGDDDARRGRSKVVCDADNGGITLPPGFCAVVVADEVGIARHIAASPSGNLYVALADSRDGTVTGGLLALRDRDGDGKADEQRRIFDRGGNGVAYHAGHLFFAPNDGVVRFRLPGHRFLPQGGPATVVSGLPTDGDHVNKTVTLSSFGHMIVNIGSASNSCQVENRVLESPGVDPCPELPVRAGVWLFNPWRTNQTQGDGRRFATGLRNMVALDFQPFTSFLFGVQNGRDQLFENWPDLYTAEDDLRLPSEELFHIRPGRDYGWPYCYHDRDLGMKVLAPEYGGDGEIEGRCARVDEPLLTFPAHWAPLSMVFYTGRQFPSRYRGGAFVAFHGSRFDPEAQPEGPGYNVVFVPFERFRPEGTFETFADGFTGGGTPLPEGAAHRPVGLAEGPDGSLYVTDDVGGRIWRIVYQGD